MFDVLNAFAGPLAMVLGIWLGTSIMSNLLRVLRLYGFFCRSGHLWSGFGHTTSSGYQDTCIRCMKTMRVPDEDLPF